MPRSLAFVAALLVATACTPAAAPPPAVQPTIGAAPAAPTAATAPVPTPLRVAASGLSGNNFAPWAALDGGFFTKHNLVVDDIPDVAASTTAVQTIVAKDLDVLNIAPNAAIEASLKGAVDLVAIANPPPGTGFWLYAAPEIRSVQDLRGKTVGANQVGSSTYFAVEYAMRERGLEVGRDFEVLNIGGVPAQLAALQQGQIQAAVLSAPTTVRARKAGFHELLDLNYIPYNANSIIVRREMLDSPTGRAALTRLVQAYVDSTARVRKDPTFGHQVLAKHLQLDDPEAIEEVYRAYLPKQVPLVIAEGIGPVLQTIAERDPSARGADPRRFYDNSLVEELQRTGYIDAQYR
jgi:NitT/TauT family transport system substrate-binding protein